MYINVGSLRWLVRVVYEGGQYYATALDFGYPDDPEIAAKRAQEGPGAPGYAEDEYWLCEPTTISAMAREVEEFMGEEIRAEGQVPWWDDEAFRY